MRVAEFLFAGAADRHVAIVMRHDVKTVQEEHRLRGIDTGSVKQGRLPLDRAAEIGAAFRREGLQERKGPMAGRNDAMTEGQALAVCEKHVAGARIEYTDRDAFDAANARGQSERASKPRRPKPRRDPPGPGIVDDRSADGRGGMAWVRQGE